MGEAINLVNNFKAKKYKKNIVIVNNYVFNIIICSIIIVDVKIRMVKKIEKK